MCGQNIVEQNSSAMCGRNIVEQKVKYNVWSKHSRTQSVVKWSKHSRTKSRVQCVVET